MNPQLGDNPNHLAPIPAPGDSRKPSLTRTGFPRIEGLARELKSDGVQAFLCATPVSMGYSHGFDEAGGEPFLTLAIRETTETCMICPALSAVQARRGGNPTFCIVAADPNRHRSLNAEPDDALVCGG